MAVFGRVIAVPIELDSNASNCVGIDPPFGEDLVATGQNHIGVMLDVSGWEMMEVVNVNGYIGCNWTR